MTTLELNEELFSQLAIISTDEGMMRKAIKALKRIVKSDKDDESTMSRKDFMARVERAEKGESKSFASVAELDKYVRNL